MRERHSITSICSGYSRWSQSDLNEIGGDALVPDAYDGATPSDISHQWDENWDYSSVAPSYIKPIFLEYTSSSYVSNANRNGRWVVTVEPNAAADDPATYTRELTEPSTWTTTEWGLRWVHRCSNWQTDQYYQVAARADNTASLYGVRIVDDGVYRWNGAAWVSAYSYDFAGQGPGVHRAAVRRHGSGGVRGGHAGERCPGGGGGELHRVFQVSADPVSRRGRGRAAPSVSFDAKATGTLSIQGTLMATGTKTVTGNETGYQLGAVSSTQRIYAGMHVLAASGTAPTLDAVIQSDDNAGFSSAATQLTFTQATGTTSEFISAAGPYTDDYWRASLTLGGTSPSFTIILGFGIE